MGEWVSVCQKRPSGFEFGCFHLQSYILTKEVQYFELGLEVLDRSRSDANIVCIAVVIVGDNC